MVLLLVWLLYPLVLVVLCLGCGLLLRRAAGGALSSVLLLPCGLAVVVVVAVLLTFRAATAPLTTPVLVLIAIAGFAFAGRPGLAALRPKRFSPWPVLAAALPFAALALPVLLTGQPGFTGYARIVDLAFQLEIAAHLVVDGRSLPPVNDTSFTEAITATLGSGYPGGTQAALASTAAVTGLDVIWAWQPFVAWLGAMLGLSLYALLGRAIASAPARAAAAGVAAQPTILYSYALASGIKELGAALFFALAAAVLVVGAHGRAAGSVRGGLPLLVAAAAGFGTFTLGIVPWLGALLLVALGSALVGRRRGRVETVRAVRTWIVLAAIAVVVTAPVIVSVSGVISQLEEGGPADLGNLAAPVPAWAALGPWLTPDHRYPLDVAGTELPTALLSALVGLLAAAGFFRALVRRDSALVVAAIAATVALAFVLWRGNTWVELKAIVVSAPIVVALAFAGSASLQRGRRRRWAAVVAGGLVAVAVLSGNALVYRGTTLAPYERLSELREIAERHDSPGRTLYPAFEEYAAYLLRRDRAVTPADDPPQRRNWERCACPDDDVGLRPGVPRAQMFSRDLDELRLDFLTGFDMLVLRQDPTHSRPPSDFRNIDRTPYHSVWRRDPGAPKVLRHFPLPTGSGERTPAQCAGVQRALRAAGSDAALAYAPAPEGRMFAMPPKSIPAGWLVSGDDRLARGPGRARFDIDVPRDSTYRVLLRGSFGREVKVSVAGRPIGAVRWAQNYPDQYEPLGSVRLAAGRHSVELVRGGRSLLPGTANDIGPESTTTRVGPLALEPVRAAARKASYAPPSGAMEVCKSARPLDWMEVVRR